MRLLLVGQNCTLHTLALLSMQATADSSLMFHRRTVPSSLPLRKRMGSVCRQPTGEWCVAVGMGPEGQSLARDEGKPLTAVPRSSQPAGQLRILFLTMALTWQHPEVASLQGSMEKLYTCLYTDEELGDSTLPAAQLAAMPAKTTAGSVILQGR